MASKKMLILAVKNQRKWIAFFSDSGFSFLLNFIDDQTARMIIVPNIFVKLFIKQRFQNFTQKAICNTYKTQKVPKTPNTDNKKQATEIIKTVVGAGGSIDMDPLVSGSMYEHSLSTLDEHQWKIMYRNEKCISK